MKSTEYNYGECETCARKSNPYCVGCRPVMASDGSFSRTLYTPYDGPITVTSQVDVAVQATVERDGGLNHEAIR